MSDASEISPEQLIPLLTRKDLPPDSESWNVTLPEEEREKDNNIKTWAEQVRCPKHKEIER